MGIALLLACPFVIPLLAGLFLVVYYERNALTWLAVLLTWKPLIATPAVFWLDLNLSPSFYSTKPPLISTTLEMSPAILITLGLVIVFRNVLLDPTRRGVAWTLLALDTLRWGSTFAIFLAEALEHDPVGSALLFAPFALAMPTIFAFVAVTEVSNYEESISRKQKKKKKKRTSESIRIKTETPEEPP